MERVLFDKAWSFSLDNELEEFHGYGFNKYSDASGAASRFYDYSNWKTVDLPHDWALTLEKQRGGNTNGGAYPHSHYHNYTLSHLTNDPETFNVGWYRKQFAFDPAWEGKRVFIEFEGVFRDATVWVNGVYLDRHTSGYTSFVLELTDHLVRDTDNSVAVRVDSDQNEGWWYEGAGIYRHVRLLIGEPTYFKYNQTVVRAETDGTVDISAVLVNDTPNWKETAVTYRVLDKNGAEVACGEKAVSCTPYGETAVKVALTIEKPHLWCVDDPYLYTLEITCGDETDTVSFGVRSVAIDVDRGFFLNGQPLKIRGACVHQDFGGVGVALSDNLNEYKIRRLKEMGVNAYRCSHHAPSPALLDVCDRLGMLVLDETRLFGTSPEAIRQMTAVIERDRNHPCVFMWALGNEEFSVQNKEWSFRLLEKVTRLAKQLDPTRPVTYAGNNGPNFEGANGAAEIRGVNYIRNGPDGFWLERYHADHPQQPIIGTEESSYVLSRGGAVNDLGSGLLDSFGDMTMRWGSTPKGWVKFFEERDYLAGSFMWTGFDYRGEPNPLHYSNVSTSFGTIDLCGMEKPPFYYYKAWWTDEPVLKLAPHWNHREGETVTVAVFTNCESITLYLNGRAIETRTVEKFDAPQFTLSFEAGVLSVKGTRNGELLHDELVTADKTATVSCVKIWEATDGDDVAIYEFAAYDENGVFCPLAAEELEIAAKNGRIVGVGNGDPANWDREQFAPTEQAKYLYTFGYDKGVFYLPEKPANDQRKRYDWLELEPKQEGFDDDYRLIAHYGHNREDPQRLEFSAVVTDVGGYEYLEFERLGSETEIYLDGEKIAETKGSCADRPFNPNRPYRFRYAFPEGRHVLTVVSTHNESDQPPMSGYVKFGKTIEQPSTVKLHYGKARAFVKSDTPQDVELTVALK